MIVTVDSFEGELTLGQQNNPYAASALAVLINKYEPKFMRMCIGDALYGELLDGLNQTPVADKWTALKDVLVQPCASYIYCYYLQMQASKTTGQGEVVPDLDSGTATSPESKLVRAWNDMVYLVGMAQTFIHINDYPSAAICESELWYEKNLYGI